MGQKMITNYHEAQCNGLVAVCKLVARVLGHRVPSMGMRAGPKYHWQKGATSIFADDSGGCPYLVVSHNGRRVLSTHYSENLFEHGLWIETVMAHHNDALRVSAERARQARDRMKMQVAIYRQGAGGRRRRSIIAA